MAEVIRNCGAKFKPPNLPYFNSTMYAICGKKKLWRSQKGSKSVTKPDNYRMMDWTKSDETDISETTEVSLFFSSLPLQFHNFISGVWRETGGEERREPNREMKMEDNDDDDDVASSRSSRSSTAAVSFYGQGKKRRGDLD